MFLIRFERPAEHELADASGWYHSEKQDAGGRFDDAIDALLLNIAREPSRFPFVSIRVQKAKLLDWPYSIYFVAATIRKEVTVVSIWHGSRYPAELRRRLT